MMRRGYQETCLPDTEMRVVQEEKEKEIRLWTNLVNLASEMENL